MSKRIRGITIEIDGNVGPLSKAMEGVNKQSRDLQTELKDVERLLKLDPKNTELLTQKKKLLADAVKVSAERLKTLETAQQQAARAFAEGKIGEEQYRAIQREVIEATSKLKALEGQLDDVNNRFKHASEKVGNFGKGLTGAGEAMMPVSAAAGAALGGIVALTVGSAAAADEINTLAKQTGLSTEEIQKFQYASGRIDVPLEVLTGSMAKLTRNMFTANEQIRAGGDRLTGAALAFDELGVSVTNTDGSLRNNQDVMADVIDALAQKTNATERDAYAMAIFGKSAQELNPLILGGADALKQMGLEAQEMGLILSQETLDGLNAVDDELEKTKAQLSATGAVISAEFGKILLPLLKQATTFIQDVAARLREMDEGTAKVVLGGLALVAVAAPLLIILGQVATGISAIIAIVPKIIAAGAAVKTFFLGSATKAGLLTIAMTKLKAAFLVLTGPIGLIIAAVALLAAGVYLLIKNWDTVKDFFAKLWDSVKQIFGAAWEWIKNMFLQYHPLGLVITHWQTITTFFINLWNTVRNIFANTWRAITENLTIARDTVFSIAQNIWDGVVGRFNSMISRIREIVAGVTDAIAAPFRRASEIVGGITKTIGGFLNRLNPFARSSPSLVDNVRAGVKAIRQEYAKLEDLKIQTQAAGAGVGVGVDALAVAAAPTVYHGPLFTVQNMIVRSNDDIENISRQLHRNIQAGVKARGGR